jgi:hypothetical protein
MFKDRKTARMVLDALPSSYMPFDIPREEAIRIGHELFPEGMLMLTSARGVVEREVACELLGRGFLFSAISALPDWMQHILVLKCDSKMNDKDLENAVAVVIEDVDDAHKLAVGWTGLACGYSSDEVIQAVILSHLEPDGLPECNIDITRRLSDLEEE